MTGLDSQVSFGLPDDSFVGHGSPLTMRGSGGGQLGLLYPGVNEHGKEMALKQLDDALRSTVICETAPRASEIPTPQRSEGEARGLAAIERVAGRQSATGNRRQVAPEARDYQRILFVHGALKVLRADVAAGHTARLAELAHGEVFSDFLEMADHLLEKGFKDAAAVIAGSTLESHMKQLCTKFAVDTTFPKEDGSLGHKKADTINADLVKVDAYNKTEGRA